MVLNDLLSILNIHTRIQLIRVIENCPRFEIDPADEFGNIKIKKLYPFLNDRVVNIYPCQANSISDKPFLEIELEFQDHGDYWDDEIYEEDDE